jgi:hypothetical protein
VFVRQIRMAATGIPDYGELGSTLQEKDLAAAYFTYCHEKRGSFLDRGIGGFFATCVQGSKLTFVGEHGCFKYQQHPAEDRVSLIIHNPTKKVTNLMKDHPQVNLPMSTPIEKNWHDYEAYITILNKKTMLFSLFKDVAKPKVEDLEADIDVWYAEITKAVTNNKVEEQQEVTEAAKRRRRAPPAAPPLMAITHS